MDWGWINVRSGVLPPMDKMVAVQELVENSENPEPTVALAIAKRTLNDHWMTKNGRFLNVIAWMCLPPRDLFYNDPRYYKVTEKVMTMLRGNAVIMDDPDA